MKQRKKSGQGLIEYALVFALLALVSIAVLTGMGQNVVGIFYSGISSNLSDAQSSINSRT